MRAVSILLVLASTAFADAGLVADLEELAAWCGKNKLIGTRNRVYETILRFDPDHMIARRWLRYRRTTEGGWRRAKSYRPPQDRNEDALPAFRARRQAVVDRYVAAVKERTKNHALARRRALRKILVLDPDNEFARSTNREVKGAAGWVLAETERARRRRDELAKSAADALKSVPEAKPSPLTAEERGFRMPWQGALQGQWWRFTGTTDMDELHRAIRIADASATFFNAAVPDEARAQKPADLKVQDCGMYYLASDEQGHELVRKHPALPESYRRFVLKLQGAWVPNTFQGLGWYDTAPLRLDATARRSVDLVFMLRYGKSEKGWVIEGLGFYLSYYLVGTRWTTFIEPSRYASSKDDAEKKLELWRNMHADGADWLALARDLRKAGKPPDLAFLTSKRVNEMTVEDLVHAYSLAAYMVEGWPDRASGFFAAYTKDPTIDQALTKAYGLVLPDLSERLARWLGETLR